MKRHHEALTLAQELPHPLGLAFALVFAGNLHQQRREERAAQEQAEAVITLSTQEGFPHWVAQGTILRGWALAEQGQGEAGIAQMRQGLAAYRATGGELMQPYFLARLAEAYGRARQPEEGLRVLAEAFVILDKNGERVYEAELYRLNGELTLQKLQVSGCKFQVPGPKSKVRGQGPVQSSKFKVQSSAQSLTPNPQSPFLNPQWEEAEAYFQKAIEIARRQEAKSLELRAVMSLSRLWQRQGRKKEARKMLAEIYGWFTEGFDTKDLKEAKALLDELHR
jgi:predicted ATPase